MDALVKEKSKFSKFISKLFGSRELTSGSISKAILFVFIPIFLTNLLVKVYMVANPYIFRFNGVGEIITPIASTNTLNSVFSDLLIGIMTGFSVAVASCYGAKKMDRLRKVFLYSVIIALVYSVITLVAEIFSMKSLLEVLNVDSEYHKDAIAYYSMVVYDRPVTCFNNVVKYAIISLGGSATSFVASMLFAVADILLNLLFTGPCHMGAMGAGLAYMLGDILETFFLVFMVFKAYKFLLPKKEDFKFEGKLIGSLLILAIPIGFQNSMLYLGNVIETSQINLFGNGLATAAAACFNTVTTFLLTPITSLGAAFAAYVGQNHGAKKLDRIKKGLFWCLAYATGITACIFAIGYFGAPHFTKIFLDKESINDITQYYTVTYLRIFCCFVLFEALIFPSRSLLSGVKKSSLSFVAGVIELTIRSVVAIFGPRLLDPSDPLSDKAFKGVCFANPFAWVITFIALAIMLSLFLFTSKGQEFLMKEGKSKGNV